jgi:FkbM family methyltransferase
MSEIAQRTPSLTRRAHRLVNRPYYWYRPAQLVLRLRTPASSDGAPRLLRTAWGSRLYCWPDPLGNSIARTGTYDLIVAETLARLADPGETAIDAGANVGVMSNLLAHAVGAGGRVISFEPHPLIFRTLSGNVSRWRTMERIETIELHQAAVSSSAGVFPLTIEPDLFAHNKGTASLERSAGGATTGEQSDPDGGGATTGEQSDPDVTDGRSTPGATPSGRSAAGNATDVRTVRLDDHLTGPAGVGVLKLDVEHHELAALHGAERLLSGGLIRDILFEEHEPPPTPVTTLLEAHGYTVLGVRQGTIGPLLSTPAEAYEKQLWDPPALLATLDPARVRRRLRRRGWVCLTARLRTVGAVRANDE